MSSPGQTGLPKLGNVLFQTVVQFPYSAYSIPRIPDQDSSPSDPSAMPHSHSNSSGHTTFSISEPLANLCLSDESVSGLLARDPILSPGQAWKKLASQYKNKSHESQDIRDIGKGNVTDDQLELAFRCGKWGRTRPSKLFLRVRPVHGVETSA